MADHPRYPGSGDDHGVGSDDDVATARTGRGAVLAVVLGIAIVVLLVVLHLTGVAGPGAH